MGFGTLFIGYFLILNIAYYAYTDLIASLIMLFATYKLGSIGRDFKKGFYSLLPFAFISAFELFLELSSVFSPKPDDEVLLGVIGILRFALIATVSFFILTGIKKLAVEVELPLLRDKARSTRVSVLIAYSFALILEIPMLNKLITTKALAALALISLVFTFVVTISALSAIYSAYMRICMPEDLLREEKLAKLEFEKSKKGRK